ncbi:MAG TPA: ATP-binding protein [Chromobacteriaceae bacterium]|nr:ATP-binding protein [Chromobacteriaceae bacterium]
MSKLRRPWFRPTLTSLFARYFLVVMVVELVIIIGFGFFVTRLYQGSDTERRRQFMEGTVALLRNNLQQQPHQSWSAVLAQEARAFRYPVKLIPGIPDDLSQEGQVALLKGQTYLDYDESLLYARLPDDQRLLQLGPLDEQTSDTNWVTDDIEILLLWILFSGTVLGLLIYFNLRPLWRDLLAVRTTAEAFAEGNFHARSPLSKSRLFAPLPLAFNSMASSLERQMETRQALAHAVAHEIRTPIARLRFGLTMLEEEDDPEQWQRYHEGMERDIQELEQLVSASMDYTKLARGEFQLRWETVDLYDWFADLIDLVTPLKPAPLTLTLDCPHHQGRFDRKLLYIASRNLLLNAFKYANHSVHLSVQTEQYGLTVCVDDDGPGIPEDDRERIFDPFLRLDRSRDRSTGGYGLGLSFVRLIAEHHGGHAEVQTSPLGGARFIITVHFPPQSAD